MESFGQPGHARIHSLNTNGSNGAMDPSLPPYSQINNVNHFNFSIINNGSGNNTNPVFNTNPSSNLTDSLQNIIKASAPFKHVSTPKAVPNKV